MELKLKEAINQGIDRDVLIVLYGIETCLGHQHSLTVSGLNRTLWN